MARKNRFTLPIVLLSLLFSSAYAGDSSVREVCERSSTFGGGEILNWYPDMKAQFLMGDWAGLKSTLDTGCASSPMKPFCDHKLGIFVWSLLMSPDPGAGRVGYDLQRGLIAWRFHRALGVPGSTFDMDAALDAAGTAPAMTYTAEEIAKTKELVDKVRKNQEYSADLEIIRKAAVILCAYQGEGFDAKKCGESLEELTRLMQPGFIGNFAYSLFDTYDSFLTDPDFLNALPRLALRVRNRIRLADASLFPDGNVFDDAVRSFRDIGLDEKTATEKAWTWMAIYSTRGASFPNFFEMLQPKQLGLGLSVLEVSAGMSYLDQLTLASVPNAGGNPYSMPFTFTTDCFYGKPYHFWMSAYFARLLRTQGKSESVSSFAAYLVGALYEFGSDTTGRDPTRNVLEPVTSAYNEWATTNLYLNALGARYGIESTRETSSPIWNVDSLFLNYRADIIHSGKLLDLIPLATKKKISGNNEIRYLFWEKKFQPLRLYRDVVIPSPFGTSKN